MANQEHVNILRQGSEIWNEWLLKNPEVLPDIRGANLSGADLRGVRLSGANLSGAVLCWADLTGADLRGAVLCGTDLNRANLSGAQLAWAIGLTWTQIGSAIGDETTELPDGIQRPPEWGKQFPNLPALVPATAGAFSEG